MRLPLCLVRERSNQGKQPSRPQRCDVQGFPAALWQPLTSLRELLQRGIFSSFSWMAYSKIFSIFFPRQWCFRLLWLLLFKIGKCRWLSTLSEYFWCRDMVSSISAIFTKRIRHSQRTSGLFFCYEFCRLFKYPLLVMLPLFPMYHCCPWMLLK